MPECTLFVKNDKEEIVGSVLIDHASEKIVVDNYTRDEQVLRSSAAFTIRSLDNSNVKFQGFAKYLRDRKKAAVAKNSEGRTLYILPPATDQYDVLSYHLGGMVPTKPRIPASASLPIPSNTIDKSAKKGDGGLLSSLLSKVDANVAAQKAAPTVVISAAAKTALSELEERVRRDMDGLVAVIAQDESSGNGQFLRKKAYEPMLREQRCIVFDVVSDYEGLVAVDEEEGPDRIIVIYKRGCEPDEDIHTLADRARSRGPAGGGNGATAAKKAAVTAQPENERYIPPVESVKSGADEFVKVNQVKRDRRTIEEIQADMKKKKMRSS